MRTARCFSQNATYDRRVPKFRGMERTWAFFLHHWNGKAVALAQQHGLNAWSEQCLKHHGKFAMHVANLPSNRWVKRVLLWNPTGARTRGYPRHDWTSKFVAYTRFHQLSQWHSLVQDPALWMQLSDDFGKVLFHSLMFWSHIACAPTRAAFGHASAKSKSNLYVRTILRNAPLSRTFWNSMRVCLEKICRWLL